MLKFNKIWNFLLKINKYIINFILDLFNILILYTIMPLYECDYCNYKTKLNSDFNKHLNTKKHNKK